MAKQSLSTTVKRIFLKSGVYDILRRLFPHSEAAILRYHAIVEPEDNFYTSPSIALSPKLFETHVKYLSRRYHVLSLDQIIDLLHQSKPFPPNSIGFTFDDGYADNFFAAQILHKYHANGTFYITTEPIDRKSRLWLSEIICLILKTEKNQLEIFVDGESHIFSFNDQSSKWSAIRQITKIIKSNNQTVREQIRSEILKKLGNTLLLNMVANLMLNWEQVNEMVGMGMLIGSHTLSHLNLPNAEPSNAIKEIRNSKEVLEKKLNNPVRHFSYPNSGPYEYFDSRIRSYVVDAGYESSTTSQQGFVNGKSDLFALQRIRTIPELSEVIHSLEWDRLFQKV